VVLACARNSPNELAGNLYIFSRILRKHRSGICQICYTYSKTLRSVTSYVCRKVGLASMVPNPFANGWSQT
jgi:hypothetical protein